MGKMKKLPPWDLWDGENRNLKGYYFYEIFVGFLLCKNKSENICSMGKFIFFNLFFYFKITMFLNIYINFSYVLLIEYGPKFWRRGFWVKINRKIYVPRKNSSKNFSFRFWPLGLWNFTSIPMGNLKEHGHVEVNFSLVYK